MNNFSINLFPTLFQNVIINKVDITSGVFETIMDELIKYNKNNESNNIILIEIKGMIRNNFKVSSRRYRNRRIGEFLKELHFTEGRNTGFRKILNAIKENGSPLPEFETDDDRSYFISRLYIHESF